MARAAVRALGGGRLLCGAATAQCFGGRRGRAAFGDGLRRLISRGSFRGSATRLAARSLAGVAPGPLLPGAAAAGRDRLCRVGLVARRVARGGVVRGGSAAGGALLRCLVAGLPLGRRLLLLLGLGGRLWGR